MPDDPAASSRLAAIPEEGQKHRKDDERGCQRRAKDDLSSDAPKLVAQLGEGRVERSLVEKFVSVGHGSVTRCSIEKPIVVRPGPAHIENKFFEK